VAGETTGVVMISAREVHPEIRGPAQSRLWRLSFIATLIEKHSWVWVITAAGHGAGSKLRHIVVPHSRKDVPAVETPILALTPKFGLPEKLLAQAGADGVLQQKDGFQIIAPARIGNDIEFEEDEDIEEFQTFPSRDLAEKCLSFAQQKMRLGVAAIPHSVLVEQHSVSHLRSIGFDVDEFRYSPLEPSSHVGW